MNEFSNIETREKKLKEAADIYIVLCGLKRLDSYVGNFVKEFWFVPVPTLYKAVVEKMNKNKARVVVKTTYSTYHHTNDE